MEKVVVGIDLGTSSMKFTVVDTKGKVLDSFSRPIELLLPKDGYAEEELSQFRDALFDGLKILANRFLIQGIAVDGQMHGLCLLDSSYEALGPCILWNDSRSRDICQKLNQDKDFLLSRTGNIAFPGFTLPKLLWVKENQPDVFSKISHILLPKDYLNFVLTGEFVTDSSDISGSLFYNIHTREYDKDILEMVGLPKEVYPSIVSSGDPIGKMLENLKKELGLEGECMVYQGAGDNMAGSYSVLSLDSNSCNISLGTSGTIYAESKEIRYPKNGAIHLFHNIMGGYCSLACMLSCCSSLNWFLKDVLQVEDYDKETSNITKEDPFQFLFLPSLSDGGKKSYR